MYNSFRRRFENSFREEYHESINNNQQISNTWNPFGDGREDTRGLDWITYCRHASAFTRVEIIPNCQAVWFNPLECGEMDSQSKWARAFGVRREEAAWSSLPPWPTNSEGFRESLRERPQRIWPEAKPLGWDCCGRISRESPWGTIKSAASPAVDSAAGVFIAATNLPLCSSHNGRGWGVSEDGKKNSWR